MSVADQLIAGLELTLTGMVTVFLLLAFMVLVIQWMSRLAHKLQPPGQPQPLTPRELASGSVDSSLVSAISAAIHRYRRDRH